jgi:hypothetical protein
MVKTQKSRNDNRVIRKVTVFFFLFFLSPPTHPPRFQKNSLFTFFSTVLAPLSTDLRNLPINLFTDFLTYLFIDLLTYLLTDLPNLSTYWPI